MDDWKVIEKKSGAEGRIIIYASKGSKCRIKSCSQRIRMAGCPDTWDLTRTTYVVIRNGREIKTCCRLTDAKKYAKDIEAAYQDGTER